MLRFLKLFLLPLLAALVLLPRTCYAFPTPTYDLESLCLVSTDVVEAALIRHHTAGQPEWKDTFTATVTKTLEGDYKVGDQIEALSLEGFDPARTGQRCILFIARKEFRFDAEPSLPIAPRVTDMLLIDSHNRVRRYFQQMNPGGLVAQGYIDSILEDTATKKDGVVTLQMGPRQEEDAGEHAYPSLEAERIIIATNWVAIDRLKPVLSHNMHSDDAPVLLNLLRRRPTPDELHIPVLSDNIAAVICFRLASLKNPAIALDALSLKQGEEVGWRSGLQTVPFETPSSLAYAQAVAQDPRQPEARRAAAAEVIRMNAN